MKTPLRDRIAFRLERYRAIRPFLLTLDGYGPNGKRRYVNRINGHVVMEGELRR